jgi:hypothetical protein
MYLSARFNEIFISNPDLLGWTEERRAGIYYKIRIVLLGKQK